MYFRLPNYGNSCYQNATLQSLLGLRPFLSEMMSLIGGPEGDQCRTLRAVAKLMVLRQKALTKSVSSHLKSVPLQANSCIDLLSVALLVIQCIHY